MDSNYPRGTCENVVYHFHGTIQTIITSYLRPVWVEQSFTLYMLNPHGGTPY